MSELSLDLLQFEEGLMKCRQIFDIPIQTYAERQRLEMLAPDRSVGIAAAYEYLQNHVTKINVGIAIPAIGLLIIALMIGVVAWGLA
jgi:hypothetical protein